MKFLLPRISVLLLVVVLAASCETTSPYSAMRGSQKAASDINPVIAIVSFEDLAKTSVDRRLGDHLADAFMVELMESGKAEVSQQKNLSDFLSQLVRKGQDLLRENQAPKESVREAEFLVRGTVNDFSVSEKRGGLFSFLGRGGKSKVAITLRVSDVRTGRILSNIRVEETVRSGKYANEKAYRGLKVGSDAFAATPLGRAMDRVISDGVAKVVRAVPRQSWDLRVAASQVDTVIINGGKNHKVRRGDEFDVRGETRYVTDPVTGAVIDQIQGPVEGKIRITVVKDQSAHATILRGHAKRGDRLEPSS